jgi:hypothetical protein
MPLIPVVVGDRQALIHTPDKPGCSTPWCKGVEYTTCDYPVRRGGRAVACGAKLCKDCAVEGGGVGVAWEGVSLCPPHARLMAKADR